MKVEYKIKENGKPTIYISKKGSGTLFSWIKKDNFNYNKSNLTISESKINNPRTENERHFTLVVRLDGNEGKYKMSQMPFNQDELLVLRDSIDKILDAGKEDSLFPFGIIPKEIWDKQRLRELQKAIVRCYSHNFEIPIAWIEEYNGLIKLYKNKG